MGDLVENWGKGWGGGVARSTDHLKVAGFKSDVVHYRFNFLLISGFYGSVKLFFISFCTAPKDVCHH